MKVMVLVKATQRSETGIMPDAKLLKEMGHFNEQLTKAGVLISGEGLLPSSKGVRVQFSGENRKVVDGPFAAINELVAGYWIWQVPSMAEAIEWVKRCPNPMPTDSEIEIRPILEALSIGDAATTHVREQEAGLRAQNFGLETPRFENGIALLIAGLNQNYMFVSRASIPSQWARFVPQIGQIPGRIGKMTFGVCSSGKSEGTFEYLSGVQVEKAEGIPPEFTTLQIPAQRYAVFTHSEHVSLIPKTMDKILKQWLPDSGLAAAASPSYERYTEKFDPQTGMGGMEIWVPIQK